jgi:hypothetical protein
LEGAPFYINPKVIFKGEVRHSQRAIPQSEAWSSIFKNKLVAFERPKGVHNIMNPKNEALERQKKLGDDIQSLKSNIAELNNNLKEAEIEFELMRKKIKRLKKYKISWSRPYYEYGEEEIEASSEKEALQIAKKNVFQYEGKIESGYEEPYIESWGEVNDY